MNISLSRQLKFFQSQIELTLLFLVLLFFPDKLSYAYYFWSALLLVALTMLRVYREQLLSCSPYSLLLTAFTLLWFWAALFSGVPSKSLLFSADIMLLALFFLSAPGFREETPESFLRPLFLLASLAALLNIVFFLLLPGKQAAFVFKNPILDGFLAAVTAIFFLASLLERFSWRDALLTLLNVASLVLNASKGPALIFIIITLLLLFKKRRRMLWLVPLALALLLAVPNPLQKRVATIKSDPYVTTRLQIWKMDLQLLRDNFWHGAGPDLFPEKAARYNFANPRGPANYYKRAESPHSDYFKILTETGFPGILFFLAAAWIFVRRRLWQTAPFWLNCLLLAFLLQMGLINFIFQPLFLFLFFLILKFYLEPGASFRRVRTHEKLLVSFLLLFALLFCYLLPFLSQGELRKAAQERDLNQKLALLQRAARLDPLNSEPYRERARLLFDYCRYKGEFATAAWRDAARSLEQALRQNPLQTDLYLLRSDLYLLGHSRVPQAAEVSAAIENSLAAALANEPRNVFVWMRSALTFTYLGKMGAARESALRALEMEPDFGAALIFLQARFRHLPEKEFRERISRIREKILRFRPQPGSYLANLWSLATLQPR